MTTTTTYNNNNNHNLRRLRGKTCPAATAAVLPLQSKPQWHFTPQHKPAFCLLHRVPFGPRACFCVSPDSYHVLYSQQSIICLTVLAYSPRTVLAQNVYCGVTSVLKEPSRLISTLSLPRVISTIKIPVRVPRHLHDRCTFKQEADDCNVFFSPRHDDMKRRTETNSKTINLGVATRTYRRLRGDRTMNPLRNRRR